METALFITIKNSADIWHRSALFMLHCSFYPEEKYVWQTIEKHCGQIMIWWRSDKGPAATLSLYLSCWSLAMQGSYLIVLGGENTGKIMIPLYNYQSDLVITTFIDHQYWPCLVSNNILLTRQQVRSYHCWCLMFDINLTIVEVDINRHSEFLRRVYERDFTSQWNPAFLFIPIPAGSILIVKTLFDWRIIPQ